MLCSDKASRLNSTNENKIMKPKKSILISAICASISFAAGYSAHGQTNLGAPIAIAVAAPVPQIHTNALTGLWDQFTGWIASPDTNNLTLETTQWRVETGPAIQSGVAISDDFFIQRNFTNRLAAISETRNASIGGTIVSQEFGVGYNLYQKYDTELTPFLAGGYRFDKHEGVGSIGVVLRHMINKVAYIAPGIQLDVGKKALPMFTMSAGVAF